MIDQSKTEFRIRRKKYNLYFSATGKVERNSSVSYGETPHLADQQADHCRPTELFYHGEMRLKRPIKGGKWERAAAEETSVKWAWYLGKDDSPKTGGLLDRWKKYKETKPVWNFTENGKKSKLELSTRTSNRVFGRMFIK